METSGSPEGSVGSKIPGAEEGQSAMQALRNLAERAAQEQDTPQDPASIPRQPKYVQDHLPTVVEQELAATDELERNRYIAKLLPTKEEQEAATQLRDRAAQLRNEYRLARAERTAAVTPEVDDSVARHEAVRKSWGLEENAEAQTDGLSVRSEDPDNVG